MSGNGGNWADPWSGDTTGPGGSDLAKMVAMNHAAMLRSLGYGSGDDMGAAGYNPRFNQGQNADPDGPSGGGQGGQGYGDQGGQGSAGGDIGGGVSGPDPGGESSGNGFSSVPDDEWGSAGGYNPHYQIWTGSPAAPVTRAPISPMMLASKRNIRPMIRLK